MRFARHLISSLAAITLTGLVACDADAPTTEPNLSTLSTCSRTLVVVEIDDPVLHNTIGHSGVIRVTNTSTTSNTAAVTCAGFGTITCTNVVPSSLTLTPGANATVNITFNAGAASPASGVIVTSCGTLNRKVKVI